MAIVVCFGEILLRLTAPGRELLLQSPRLDVYVGGAEANVAVGLARLGHAVSMASVVPDNPLGSAACGELRRHGVAVNGVRSAMGRMGLYFLASGAGHRASEIVYDRAFSAFSEASPALIDWGPLLNDADRLHVSGITPAVGLNAETAALRAMQAARAAGVAISFDVNFRARLWQGSTRDPGSVLSRLAGYADILFANHHDIAMLLGRTFSGEEGTQRREAALAALTAFPQLEWVASTERHIDDTDRHRIAARIDGHDEFWTSEEVALAGIVDRIGAGDALAVGVLHARHNGRDAATACRFGLALACLKHTLPGDASLFAHSDIDAFLAGDVDVRR